MVERAQVRLVHEADRGHGPTISEVAAEAGVGRATAARTLGGYGYVSPELRARVLAAAEKLGYRANALARSMSTGVSHTLGVIVADIGNPFFAGLLRGISDSARARGFDVIVLSTYEDLQEEIAATNVLIDRAVAALDLDALDDAHIPFDPELVMVGPKTEARVVGEVGRMLALPDRVTAVFCTETDGMTGSLRALRQAGLSYPDDVALIGFDDSAWAAVMDPPLTMIAQPVHQLGAKAAEVLLDILGGAEPARTMHTLRSELIQRASVASPPE
ncbi:LacI family DNA-binding transcriptional regulator [Nonomuraea angiospora]|uniref:LacI family DNA-binding transcriptional regulator n=1 Tax=Nonomuraea angiospora TaxID=46172 RepID=UPI00331E694F